MNFFHLKFYFFSYTQAVERRGEMIVRTLEPRCLGGRHAVEAAQQLLSQADENHTVQVSYYYYF